MMRPTLASDLPHDAPERVLAAEADGLICPESA
jgi:hypothetical protein